MSSNDDLEAYLSDNESDSSLDSLTISLPFSSSSSPANDTELKPQFFQIGTLFSGFLLCLIIAFTLAGNCLVCAAVASYRRLRSSVTNYFVVSLAVADLTVAILVMPYSVAFELYGKWRYGWVFCYFWISCDVTCCTASILHLCVISLDRYASQLKLVH